MDCGLMDWRLIFVLMTFGNGFAASQSTEASHNVKEGDNITYVSSTNLNGMAVLSTLTIETTTSTAYDQLDPSMTTKRFKEIEESQATTTRKMRKVLKHIYKRPIHSENDEKINKQDVLLNYRDSGKDLLTAFQNKLTDVNKSDVILMNEPSTTDSGILNKEYNKSSEVSDNVFTDSFSTNVFEIEKADLKVRTDHQIKEDASETTTKSHDIFSTSIVEENEESLFEFNGVTEHDIFDLSDNEEIQKYIKLLGQTKSYPQIAIETTTDTITTSTPLKEENFNDVTTTFAIDSTATEDNRISSGACCSHGMKATTENIVVENFSEITESNNTYQEMIGGAVISGSNLENQDVKKVFDEFFKFNKTDQQIEDIGVDDDEDNLTTEREHLSDAAGEETFIGDHTWVTNNSEQNFKTNQSIIPTISLPSLDEIIHLTPEMEYTSDLSVPTFNQTEIQAVDGTDTTVTEVQINYTVSYVTSGESENTDTTQTLEFLTESMTQEGHTEVPVILLTHQGLSGLNFSSDTQSDIFSLMNHSPLDDESLDLNDTFAIPKLEGLTADSEEFGIDSNEKPMMDDEKIILLESGNNVPDTETTTTESHIMVIPTKIRTSRKHKCRSDRENKKKRCGNRDRVENTEYVVTRIFGQKANFSIAINIQNTTSFIPSNVTVTEDFANRTLNMSWLALNGKYNNSLMIIFPAEDRNITGVLELGIVEGDDMRIWRKELDDGDMTDLGWTTNLETGAKIIFNNLRWKEFFETGETLEANFSMGGKNRDKVFHVLMAVGICVILAVLGFLFFYIVAKRKHDNEMDLRQSSLGEGTITDKQTPL